MSKQPKQILIVDDDSSLRSLLKLVIEEEGYQVIEAQNGEDCLRKVARNLPDLILLDAIMPGMNGFDCCQHLRNSLITAEIPILMITFLEDQESIEKAFNAGATDYITKPIHWAVLLKRLERLMISSQAIKQLNQNQEHCSELQEWQNLINYILESYLDKNYWSTLLKMIQNYFQVEQVIYFFSYQNTINIKSTLSASLNPKIVEIPSYFPEEKSPVIIESQNLGSADPKINTLISELNLNSNHFLLSITHSKNVLKTGFIFLFSEQKLWQPKTRIQIKQLMIVLNYLSFI